MVELKDLVQKYILYNMISFMLVFQFLYLKFFDSDDINNSIF